jgi:hypothetical protein
MAKKPDKKDCLEIRVCVFDDMNARIEMFKATELKKGIRLKKPETAELLIELGLKSQGL